ncbi:TylF/MycF family methyltransferase [Acidimicrobiales bacterium]|nr:TylF/MycF family methyltransferase [Acidimicrobiales bacterium]MDC3300129.1 TylF/MycF family methyltransferase [Acidimicrobiales bacterium]
MIEPNEQGAAVDVDLLTEVRRRYLNLMKHALTRYVFAESWQHYEPRPNTLRHAVFRAGRRVLDRKDLELVLRFPFDPALRADGRDWPPEADTMVGLKRLDNIEFCVSHVIADDVPGDLIETGVWRGGASIFMRAVLEAYGDPHRSVWLADSFRGLPPARPERTDDVEDALWSYEFLAVPIDQVRTNFQRYSLLDDRVKFLEGWFEDTLPTAPIDHIAVIRLDGDMYDSTMVALESLYPKLSVGGYVIVDDYGAVKGCRQAVDEFRSRNSIADEMHEVDWTCQYWRRSS